MVAASWAPVSPSPSESLRMYASNSLIFGLLLPFLRSIMTCAPRAKANEGGVAMTSRAWLVVVVQSFSVAS